MNNRSFGALPPPGFEWMMGRTVKDIEAIRKEAEETGKEPSEIAASDKWKDKVISNPITIQ